MKHKLLTIFSLLSLSACSNHAQNYYLNDFVISEDLQAKPTSELAFNNIIYSKVLDKQAIAEQLSYDFDDYTVVFFAVENLGEDPSYFNFNNSSVETTGSGKRTKQANLYKFFKTKSIDLNSEDDYMNPFANIELSQHNQVFNINNKILNNFSLSPGQSKQGFLVFNKLKEANILKFRISSGVSIHTDRKQEIKLDY